VESKGFCKKEDGSEITKDDWRIETLPYQENNKVVRSCKEDYEKKA